MWFGSSSQYLTDNQVDQLRQTTRKRETAGKEVGEELKSSEVESRERKKKKKRGKESEKERVLSQRVASGITERR